MQGSRAIFRHSWPVEKRDGHAALVLPQAWWVLETLLHELVRGASGHEEGEPTIRPWHPGGGLETESAVDLLGQKA